MDSIRVNSGVKVIEVNDKGETISLPLSDDSFVKGFFDLLNEIKDKATAISEKKGDVLDTLDDIVAFDKDVRGKNRRADWRKYLREGVWCGSSVLRPVPGFLRTAYPHH